MTWHGIGLQGAVRPEPLEVEYGEKIGAGGFGAVYGGMWNGKSVAIKVRASFLSLLDTEKKNPVST